MNRTAQSRIAFALTLVILSLAAFTTFPTNIASGSSPSSSTGVSGLEGYFTRLWNAQVGLISVGTQTSCNGACGGVQFNFMNDTGAPIFPTAYRFLPNEDWADAEAFIGLGFRPDISSAILNTLQSLESSVGWRPAENRESQWGFITSFDKTNNNIVFLTPKQTNLNIPGTKTQYQIDSAARWNFNTQSWVPFNSNVNAALGCSQATDETLFQALNLYIRGDTKDAKANLQCEANTLTKNPDGSVLIGPAPARGMYLGSFLEAAEVIGTPTMPSGITLNDVTNTIWGLQQSDGGIARQYSDFSTNVLGSDDETTNAALLAFSPGVISDLKSMAASGQYTLSSVPDITPQLTGGSGTTTTSTSSTTSSTSTSKSTTTRTTSSTTGTRNTTSTSSTSSTSSNSSTSSTSSTSTLTSDTTSISSLPSRTTSNSAVGTSEASAFSLQIVGGCSVTGEGTYAPGTAVTVTSLGVCNRENGTGTRITSWSIDGQSPQAAMTSGQVDVTVQMNQNHIITFNSVPQYQLTLDQGATLTLLSITPPAIQGDDYWYDSGQSVIFTGHALSGDIQVVGWSLDDGQMTAISPGSRFTVSIPDMNASYVIHAAISSSTGCASSSCNDAPRSTVYFDTNEPSKVNITVDGVSYPASVSFSWPDGSTHTISAPATLQGSRSRAAFRSWVGTINSTDSVLRFVLNGTTKFSLDYRVQYLVKLTFDDSTGNQIVPENATIDGSGAAIHLPGNLSAWLNYGGKYVLASALWQGTEVAGSGAEDTFHVDSPSQYALPLMIYPQTIKVEDPYGLPLGGVNVQISTVGGEIMSDITNAQGVATFDVPLGLYYASADFLGISSTVWQGSLGSHSLTLTVYLSYPVIGTVIPLTILPVLLLLLIRHRRNEANVVHEIWFRRSPSRVLDQGAAPARGTDE